MPNDITPEATIIELNRIRTDKGERPPEIDGDQGDQLLYDQAEAD